MNKKLLICLISFFKIQSAERPVTPVAPVRDAYSKRDLMEFALYNHILLEIDLDPKYAQYLEDSINAFNGFERLPTNQKEQAQRLGGMTLEQYTRFIDGALSETLDRRKCPWKYPLPPIPPKP